MHFLNGPHKLMGPNAKGISQNLKRNDFPWELNNENIQLKTRTTIVVRNARCTRSRYTLKLSLIFFNHLINQQSISRTAYPPLKIQLGGNKKLNLI